MADKKTFPPQFSGQGPEGHVNSAKTAIEIFHLISGTTVKFLPFITDFRDSHRSDWSEESVYGRMDDLLNFQRTKRTINITFDCPSYSEDDALANFKNLSLLKQFMYPSYAGNEKNALRLKGAPLFRVKLLNFINSLSQDGKGLLCKISEIQFIPNSDAGYYIINQNTTSPQNRNNVIIPKLFSITLDMNILHEYTPSWNTNGTDFKNSLYPYNLQSPLSQVNTTGENKGSAVNKNDRPIDIANSKKVLGG